MLDRFIIRLRLGILLRKCQKTIGVVSDRELIQYAKSHYPDEWAKILRQAEDAGIGEILRAYDSGM